MKVPSMPTYPLIQTKFEPPIDMSTAVEGIRVTQAHNLRDFNLGGLQESPIQLGAIQLAQTSGSRVKSEWNSGLIR